MPPQCSHPVNMYDLAIRKWTRFETQVKNCGKTYTYLHATMKENKFPKVMRQNGMNGFLLREYACTWNS